jgi:hypothetical protein
MIVPLKDSTDTTPSELKAPPDTEDELAGEAVREILVPFYLF